MDPSASPHTPPNPRTPGGSQQSSPLFGSPSPACAAGADNQSSPAQRHEAPNRKLGIHQFINKDQFSDITIIYGPGGLSKFKAHKIILASSSLWFQAAFSNASFIESNASEITLHDDYGLAMTTMLKACYNPPLNIYESAPPWTTAEKFEKSPFCSNLFLLFHVDVYVVADKYLLGELRQRAAQHVSTLLRQYLEAARKDKIPAVIIAAMRLPEILTKVYEATAAGDENTLLRKAVLDVILSHSTTRSTGEPGVMAAEVMRCAREVDGFGKDMYIRTMSDAANSSIIAHLEVVEQVLCPRCNIRWMKPVAVTWDSARCIKCGLAAEWKEHTVARLI